jgi:hypothetical protein
MRIQHACGGCGVPIDTIRAVPDPRYGLPIVTCPRCGTSAVRTWHETRRARRRLTRRLQATGVLALQTLLALVTIISATGICIRLSAGAGLGSNPLTISGVFAIALGAWLTAGLAHWPRWTPWLALALVVAAICAIEPLVMGYTLTGVRRLDATGSGMLWLLTWADRLLVLLVLLLASLIGVPIGRGAIWMLEERRRSSLARHRIRRRRAHRRVIPT